MTERIPVSWFQKHDAEHLAQALLGKTLVRRFPDGRELRAHSTETEAYFGSDDLASHARKPENSQVARCTY
jgi:DNA-3-methyladenine glycosylase